MSENQDLVVIAKTWIQRDEQLPINFDEIWERAGYTDRRNAKAAWHRCVSNFSLAKDLDFRLLNTDIQSGPGRPGHTWQMTVGAAKRFLASAQTEAGYKVIEALIQAEEELQAVKSDLSSTVAAMVDSRMNAVIPMMVEKVTAGVLASVIPQIRQITADRPRGLSMRELVARSRTLVAWHDTIHQNYGYSHVQAARSFGKIVKTAARNAGALIGKQNGVEVYDESKLLEIVEKASVPMAMFSKRNRKRFKPAANQMNLSFASRN